MDDDPQARMGSAFIHWLALDNKENSGQYRAIKMFTVVATEALTGENERDLLLGPAKNIETNVPKILSYFLEPNSRARRIFVSSFTC